MLCKHAAHCWVLLTLVAGVSTSQPDHLKFVYELSDEFSVLPSFIVQKAVSAARGAFTGDTHGLSIDPTQVP